MSLSQLVVVNDIEPPSPDGVRNPGIPNALATHKAVSQVASLLPV